MIRSAVILAILFAANGIAFAQADPFGAGADPFGGGAAPADPFGGGATPADPFGGGATPAPTAPSAPAAPLPNTTDPLILAIAETNPTTPNDLMRAVFTLVDYGAPVEAKQYLARLIAANPDKATLAELHKTYTSGPFFTLLRNDAMRPEGAEFAERVLKAADEALQDPARLEGLVKQLNDPDILTRSRALTNLRNAGQASIDTMISALADGSRASEHRYIELALARLGQAAEGPMLAVLEAKDPALRAHAARVLGGLKSHDAVQHLVGPFAVASYPPELRRAAGQALLDILGVLPTKQSAEVYLRTRAESYLRGETPDIIGGDGAIEVWRWDNDAKQSKPVRYPAADASLAMAAKLSRDLHEFKPDDQAYYLLYLTTHLELEKRTSGFAQPLSQGHSEAVKEATQAGVDVVESVLDIALRENRTGAALAAIEILTEIGDDRLLHSTDGQPRLLVSAMRNGDARVRMAAANAVVHFQPQSGFPGASYLMEVLGRAVRATGHRRAIVAYPRLIDAQSFAGLLERSGFDADFAVTGRSLLAQAIREPDYQIILLSDVIDQPQLRDVIRQLRRDPRTMYLPIGIMCRAANLPQLRLLADEDPRMLAFPQPYEVETMADQAYNLIALAGREGVSGEEYEAQGLLALKHLQTVLAEPARHPFFSPLEVEQALVAAIRKPAFTEGAAAALGLLGTPKAQTALVETASENAAHYLDRLAAAKAFQTAVQRRGLLLTTAQLEEQYKRFNLSSTLPGESQQILGYLLDVIESPADAAPPATSPPRPSGE